MSAQPLPAPLPPLPADASRQVQQLLTSLDTASLWWVSGYAAGLAQAQRGAIAPVAVEPVAAAPAAAASSARATVLYGSQTGNARRTAEALAAELEAAGLGVRLVRADAYPQRELKDETLLYAVISTQGDGEPPEDSLALFEFLAGRRAPTLPQLRYAVLGLGDSSYPQFNAAARRLDELLAARGATALIARAEADLDIDAVAAPWQARALEEARRTLSTPARSEAVIATVTPLRRAPVAPSGRDAPFAAEVIANQRLTGRDSAKDVRHLELDLSGSGLTYEPGDALGVWAENPPALVEEVLALTGLDGSHEVQRGERRAPLSDWLLRERELTRASRALLTAIAARGEHADLADLLADNARSATWLGAHASVDALARWRAEWTPDALVEALRPLTPRMYSIASSRAVVGDEAHLTVDVVRWASDGRIRTGAASSHLARQLEGGRVRVFVEPNERFRLPEDGQRDVIMIGPGTGVAPFRGFLQQRGESGARGRNWLLFGAQRQRQDFLYQLEWQDARRRGLLTRLDVAFSRDQAHKVYVQQRIAEHGAELYAWLAGGAHLYVCGAIAMGKDVHAALVDVVATHGGRDREGADAWLRELQQAGRYARDVY